MEIIKLMPNLKIKTMLIFLSYTHEFVMVPMRDGVSLATDVYKPTFYTGRLHTILVRTPYGRTDVGLNYLIPYITDVKGYALVIQSLRGFQGSEGEPSVFRTDGWGDLQDGYDAINWIISQSWSSGSVCGAWFSAMGITQYLLSGTLHPAYKCAFPIVGAHSIYHYAAFYGGEFRKNLVENWLGGLGVPHLIDSIANHPSYDSTWAIMNLEERSSLVNAPMLHLAGWFDIFSESQIKAFVELQFNGGPYARGNQKIIIGPWGHLTFGQNVQGDLTFPTNAIFSFTDLLNLLGRWYDYWLKGINNGIMDEPPVKFYIIGINEWAYSDTFPPRGVYPRKWYLHGDGSLRLYPPTSVGFSSYIYDPNDPTPTIGGNEMSLAGGTGPKDQRPLLSRSDVLVFQSDVLTDTVVVIGNIIAKLYIESDRYDTDFAVRIADVFPDGKAILVSDGIIKARYRYGFDREVLLNPGVIDSVEVKVWATAWAFMPGHRIMVIISSANYPRFEANPNNGGPFVRDDPIKLPANNKVYHSSTYPSHIILPMYPSTSVREMIEQSDKNIIISANRVCGEGEIRVYDVSGRVLFEGMGCTQPLKRGVYFVRTGNRIKSIIIR